MVSWVLTVGSWSASFVLQRDEPETVGAPYEGPGIAAIITPEFPDEGLGFRG